VSLTAKLLSASGGAVDKLYVDDVFSTYLYTGNGSTQTITNGIDLAGEGGMVWTKSRTDAANHRLHDTVRGVGQSLATNLTNANINLSPYGVTAFGSTGFSVSDTAGTYDINKSAYNYVSWTFRKAPKFFDVVTYTGDGTSNRQIAHSLGIAPGMIILKNASTVQGWPIYHRSTGVGKYIDFTTGASNTAVDVFPDVTSTYFVPTSKQADWAYNTTGQTYVAYVLAHDTDTTNGIIQCGSWDDSVNRTVTLGWEPQYVLFKDATVSAGSTGWRIVDSSRGIPTGDFDPVLYPNLALAEATAENRIDLTATGFQTTVASGGTYIYLAIRRPNKPPTSGTQVYNAIARTGTGAAATVTGVGFAPDLLVCKYRNAANNGSFIDRLRGTKQILIPDTTGAELVRTDEVTIMTNEGVNLGVSGSGFINSPSITYINHFFKRAPGVFDVVCYTGTATTTSITHNLTAAPELVIVKKRGVDPWFVDHPSFASTEWIYLNSVAGKASGSGSFGTHTTTTFELVGLNANSLSETYVAYLFATKAGISKVGIYTGDGSTGRVIDCGFTTGARFVMIKHTDNTGDWFVYDTARTFPAGNDYHLSLNSTAEEVVTSDDLDYHASGFIVNQNVTTNLNVTSATYLVLSFA